MMFVERKHSSALGNHLDKRTPTEKVLSSLAAEAAREAITAHRTTAVPLSQGSLYTAPTVPAPVSYNLGESKEFSKLFIPTVLHL